MNNEPVAWMVESDEDVSFIMCGKGFAKPDESWNKVTPVYTHPVEEQDESFDRTASHMAGKYVSYSVKELTDEEIDNLENLFTKLNERWGDDLWIDASHLVDLASAIAILRKAQEK